MYVADLLRALYIQSIGGYFMVVQLYC